MTRKITLVKIGEFRYLTDGEVYYDCESWEIPNKAIKPVLRLPKDLFFAVWAAALKDAKEAYALLIAAKLRGEW